MAGEHPKATFTWRKTTWKYNTLYTLTGWEGVLKRDELPYEYLNFGSAAFWATGSEICCVDLHNIMTPPTLRVGSVLREVDFVIFKAYVAAASNNLHDVRLKVGESEEIVVEVEPSPPDPSNYDPSVAFDDGVVIDKKPTLLERVERILHGWNKETAKE